MVKNFLTRREEVKLVRELGPHIVDKWHPGPHISGVDILGSDQTVPDQISDLPGLTYNINFKQYSGYLDGAVSGNYLHYW